MSDYLWDKTGEVDAEAERLENLLGQLRFQPTPFDLPAELPAKDFRATRARRSVLSWPRLAVAASLTLAVLAGAWLVLRQQTGTTINSAPELAKENGQPGTSDKQPTAPDSTDPAASNGAGDKRDGDEKPDAAAPERKTNREERGGLRPRPRRPDLAVNPTRRLPRSRNAEAARATKRRDNFVSPHVELTRREEVARAEREAAEKVLYALRVTSEKLNYARQQVQESGRNEPNR